MSLITRCPACETMFKVVPDQLRISEGWVRCGQCDEVFDASLHLLPSSGELVPEAAGFTTETTEHHVETPPDLVGALELEAQPVDIPLDMDQLEGDADLPLEQEPVLQSELDDVVDAPLSNVVFSQSESELTGAQDDEAIASEADLASGDGVTANDISFLRARRAEATPRRPLVRASWVLMTCLLLLGLTGQVAVHERDRIAASEPGLKPWLMAICETLNCTVSPLRRIDAIAIESSSFTKIRGNAYRLNLAVKNTAPTPLAAPAIELTLTDSRDQPVVRRVFLPSELAAKSDTLAAGSEWPVSVAMAITAAGATDRVAGYRLLAFYP